MTLDRPLHMSPLPRHLFKFRGDRDFYRDLRLLIEQRKLWFAEPASLNDPYDCNPGLVLSDETERRSFLVSTLDGIPESEHPARRLRIEQMLANWDPVEEMKLAEIRASQLKNWAVCSLSRPRNHPALWAHYGGNFAGFAVGYRSLVTEPNPWVLVEVEYSAWRSPMTAFCDNPKLLTMVSRKAWDWRHEREWRLLQYKEGGAAGPVEVPVGSIAQVCIGPRMGREQRAELIESASKLPDRPQLVDVRLRTDRYGLDFVPIPRRRGAVAR